MDGVVHLPDGRLAVLEVKTCLEDISPDSEYWLRLRQDRQSSLHFLTVGRCTFQPAFTTCPRPRF